MRPRSTRRWTSLAVALCGGGRAGAFSPARVASAGGVAGGGAPSTADLSWPQAGEFPTHRATPQTMNSLVSRLFLQPGIKFLVFFRWNARSVQPDPARRAVKRAIDRKS